MEWQILTERFMLFILRLYEGFYIMMNRELQNFVELGMMNSFGPE